jgi:hypothetical protein
MALFIKIATGIIVLLYIFAVNKYQPKTIKKSLKSPLKNNFSAFGNTKAQLTTKEVLKLLGHENHPFSPANTDSNLPADTEVDPIFKP